jgi:hypothetical protein
VVTRKEQPLVRSGGVPARLLRVTLALLCLFSPLILLWGTWRLAPVVIENIHGAYTPTYYGWFANAEAQGITLSEKRRAFYLELAVEDFAIETVVRTWNVLPQGILLAAILTVLSLLIYNLPAGLRARLRHRGLAQTAAIFAVSVIAGCLFWPTAAVLCFAMAVTAAFALNFPLANKLQRLMKYGTAQLGAGVALVLGAGMLHILAPALLLLFAVTSVVPERDKPKRVALWIGRFLTCCLGYSLLSLCFLSFRPIAQAPDIRQLLATRQLYGLTVDPVAKRILVTDKKTSHHRPAYAFRLDDLSAPPKHFTIPSSEVEKIHLDVTSRRIYHVDRQTKRLVVMNADTFDVLPKEMVALHQACSGSTDLALSRSSRRLIVMWENGFGSLVDLNTLQTGSSLMPFGCLVLHDDINNVFYILGGKDGGPKETAQMNEKLFCVDDTCVFPLDVKFETDGMGLYRMCLSRKRRELYVSVAGESEIRVYSTPDLKVLRKLPAQFAVRAIALDDERGLLLAGSVVTGYVDVMDVESGKTLQHQYVAKYGRNIALDTERRQAFMTSTTDGLFVLKY